MCIDGGVNGVCDSLTERQLHYSNLTEQKKDK